MKYAGIAGLFLLVAAVLFSGCTADQMNIDAEKLADDISEGISGAAGDLSELSEKIPAGSSKDSVSETGGNWVLWRESNIDVVKNGYQYERPNDNGVLYKNLKVTVDTENNAPVDLRFMTAGQLDDYSDGWRDCYEYHKTSTFDRSLYGYISFHSGIAGESVEAHDDSGIVFAVEPHNNMPAKGVMKIYYKK